MVKNQSIQTLLLCFHSSKTSLNGCYLYNLYSIVHGNAMLKNVVILDDHNVLKDL